MGLGSSRPAGCMARRTGCRTATSSISSSRRTTRTIRFKHHPLPSHLMEACPGCNGVDGGMSVRWRHFRSRPAWFRTRHCRLNIVILPAVRLLKICVGKSAKAGMAARSISSKTLDGSMPTRMLLQVSTWKDWDYTMQRCASPNAPGQMACRFECLTASFSRIVISGSHGCDATRPEFYF